MNPLFMQNGYMGHDNTQHEFHLHLHIRWAQTHNAHIAVREIHSIDLFNIFNQRYTKTNSRKIENSVKTYRAEHNESQILVLIQQKMYKYSFLFKEKLLLKRKKTHVLCLFTLYADQFIEKNIQSRQWETDHIKELIP